LFLKTDGAGNLSFDSLSFSTPLAVIGNATAGSEIRLPEDTDNGSNYVALKAPDTLSADLTLTLPSADGTSGQVLQTNGSGVLSFAGVSASAGQVIQVITATDTSERSTTSTSFVTASNTLSVSITPSSASNKIFLLVSSSGRNSEDGRHNIYTIYRGATNIGHVDNGLTYYVAQNRTHALAMSFLDSPNTTSATTYQVYLRTNISDCTVKLNDNNGGSGAKGSITAFEIKG
jgi:hypothetical protein